LEICKAEIERKNALVYGLDDRGVGVSSPGRVNKFLFSTSSHRLWCEDENVAPANAEVKKNVDLYIHSPIRLYGVVLN
jgi:hypothetical protein